MIGAVFKVFIIPMLSGILVSCVSSNDLWNAALCKPADMESIYKGAEAARAVDGSRRPDFYGGSCVHTSMSSTTHKWWLVDLMDVYMVHQVVITNRLEYSYRLRDMSVDLFLSDPRLSPSFPQEAGELCAAITTARPAGTHSFSCDTPTWARYVKITKFDSDVLNFCEAEVMVSTKQGALYRDPISQKYRRYVNSTLQNGNVSHSLQSKSHVRCAAACLGRRNECTAFHWTQGTRTCQLLNINLYANDPLTSSVGTDFFIRRTVQCLGDGQWGYV